MAIGFREAKPADAAALGELHVASWRESYAGLLPDDLLKGLSPDERSTMWSAVLGDPASTGTTVIVAESGGEIVAFGACAGQRDEALKRKGFDAEIGAIYVLRSHQRAGVGHSLMSLMARKLLEGGRRGASLWVLRTNVPARAFYEGLGGVVVGARTSEEAGATLAEVAYGWSDLSALVP
jgi:ribosomal protein S18 acetylase RimI-like enzyme